MKLLIQSPSELSSEEIIRQLRQLRHHALIDSSHFAVAAIIQIQRPDGQFAYVSGVNVEHKENNRLGMHAEQNAIAAAVSLFGKVKFSKAWVMGALDTIEQGSDHMLANSFVKPCGHCRQILMSFSLPETEIYSVTLNGVIGEPENIASLLPNAFSERDLETPIESTPDSDLNDAGKSLTDSQLFSFMSLRKADPKKLLQQSIDLSDDNVIRFCQAISPHVINEDFETSDIHACVIKIKTDTTCRYFGGALVQDIAFLTTDAIFSTLGQAITELGGNQVELAEIHLYGQTLNPGKLSGAELDHLVRFSNQDTLVKFHNALNSKEFTLQECIHAVANRYFSSMQSKSMSQPLEEIVFLKSLTDDEPRANLPG